MKATLFVCLLKIKPQFQLLSKLCIILLFTNVLNTHGQKSSNSYTNQAIGPLTADDSIKMADDCFKRRQYLQNRLGEGIIIINNNEQTNDYFFYLTGWNNKPASCIIDLGISPSSGLFINESNPYSIIWNGYQPGKEEAKRLGSNSFDYYDFKKHLKAAIKSQSKIFLLSQDKVAKESLKKLILNKTDSSKLVYIDTIINEMRLIKSENEIQNIKKAINITINALHNAYKETEPGKFEYEIGALFNYEYTRNGLKEAFPSIIGSGKNGTYLHYSANNKILNKGDLLLMDVGAEYNGYAADITRTIPVNGKFSNNQLDLYNLVLKAQEEGIKTMKPGNKILDFHQKCNEVLTKGLYQLGFITDTNKLWQQEIFILYQAGHYLGLDVHDVGRYSKNSSDYVVVKPGFRGRDLLPGMVITIEPGLYINPEMLKYMYDIFYNKVSKEELDAYVKKTMPVFLKYANMGIRIEDDILITSTGNEVLSDEIPKNPAEIEKLMKK